MGTRVLVSPRCCPEGLSSVVGCGSWCLTGCKSNKFNIKWGFSASYVKYMVIPFYRDKLFPRICQITPSNEKCNHFFHHRSKWKCVEAPAPCSYFPETEAKSSIMIWNPIQGYTFLETLGHLIKLSSHFY